MTPLGIAGQGLDLSLYISDDSPASSPVSPGMCSVGNSTMLPLPACVIVSTLIARFLFISNSVVGGSSGATPFSTVSTGLNVKSLFSVIGEYLILWSLDDLVIVNVVVVYVLVLQRCQLPFDFKTFQIKNIWWVSPVCLLLSYGVIKPQMVEKINNRFPADTS